MSETISIEPLSCVSDMLLHFVCKNCVLFMIAFV